MGRGGLTTSHPAFLKSSIWLQGRSGLDKTSPSPITLKVASMCIGFGSLKLTKWSRIPRVHLSIPSCIFYHVFENSNSIRLDSILFATFLCQVPSHPLEAHVVCHLASLRKNVSASADKIGRVETGFEFGRHKSTLRGQTVAIFYVFDLQKSVIQKQIFYSENINVMDKYTPGSFDRKDRRTWMVSERSSNWRLDENIPSLKVR